MMQKSVKNPQKMIQRLRKIIFDGEFPIESVLVHGIPLNFMFSDISFPVDFQERLDFFDNVVTSSKVSQKFISLLPHIIFQEILKEYQNFRAKMGTVLLETLKDFVKTPESRGFWKLYKNSKPEYVISIKDNSLNAFQKQWILLNSYQDTENDSIMVTNIFEALRPWLDKELYSKVKEEEEGESFSRENAFYDDASEDDRLRAKAKKLVKEEAAERNTSQQVPETDLDIITLEDE